MKYTRHYPSIAAAVAIAEQRLTAKPCHTSAASITTEATQSWSLGATLPDAIELAKSGWADGAAKIKSMTPTLSRELGSLASRFDWQHSISGTAVDAGAYAAGSPTCLLEPTPVFVPQSGPVVHIAILTAVMADVPADRVIRRGVAIAALVDALEHSGRRVQLTSLRNTRFHSERDSIDVTVCVKMPQDPLDLDAVAFVCAHPAWNRRIMFAELEHTWTPEMGEFPAGYGRGKTITADPRFDVLDFATYDEYNQWRDDRVAARTVAAILTRLGITTD